MKKLHKQFEQWILKNYTGQILETPPKDWNQNIEFFYKINGLQYRIQIKDVPKKFLKGL